jgi:hypothetical protein
MVEPVLIPSHQRHYRALEEPSLFVALRQHRRELPRHRGIVLDEVVEDGSVALAEVKHVAVRATDELHFIWGRP